VIEDGCLIGIGARVLDGARIGAGSLVAAGAVVREGTAVPPGSLVLGVPASVKRALSPREVEILRRTPERYRALADAARAACLAAGLPDPCGH
jgi:carbonic anhydrase/acetyltransferase-like protein (isoleucine patch superfamily)